ncbi:MAG: DUF4922 domain-containing protein [Bacteroidetes bacterium]|nr:DUF4922 domain-containing protein [Bacteroidota bacterium]
MFEKVIVDDNELKKYTSESSLAERMKALISYQQKQWDLAGKGYKQLKSIKTKELDFTNFSTRVQFNPGRIISSSAKVDEKTIKERKCFLCSQNLPEDQKGLQYFRDYLILVNPFPIFPEHFTIPKIDHVPQFIKNNFEGMLRLTKDIGKYYSVFYNGPNCGASAPDHMHFQAGTTNNLPLEIEYESIIKKCGRQIFEDEDLKVFGVPNYICKFYSIESSDQKSIVSAFEKIYEALHTLKQSNSPEPMLNIISSYEKNKWRVMIFPRAKHRPHQFFEEGKKNILLSPAAVDLGGICITPREEDFKKISKDDVEDILRQVSIPLEFYEYITKHLRKKLN